MHVMKLGCLFLLVHLMAAIAQGQTPGAPPPAAPETPKEVVPAVELQVIPGDKIGGVSLDDMLDYLKDKVPGFNSTVVRPQGMSNDYPMMPQMTLKNVTVGQFLELLRTSFPGVTVTRIDNKGPAGAPLYVVRVISEQRGSFGMPPGAGGFPGMPGGVGGIPTPVAPAIRPIVKVYRLTEIVANLNGDPKKSMDDVLSLLQAALDQTDKHGDQPLLKLHQPTQTLVFKGMPDQQEVLEQVLDSLRPKESDKLAEARNQMQQMKMEFMNVSRRRDEAEAESLSQRDEIKKLQADLMTKQLQLQQTVDRLNAVEGDGVMQRLKDRRATEAKSATQP
jgi:hypothetical protein